VGREKERDLSEDFNVDGRINIKMVLREILWVGRFIWLRIGTSEGLL
jgi:hypothetical protein